MKSDLMGMSYRSMRYWSHYAILCSLCAEVLATAVSCSIRFLQTVASPDSSEGLSFETEVDFTDG